MADVFQPNGIVTLTTDFGLKDAYVAIMKGVILGIAPHARIIDYTHGITPGNMIEAAFMLNNGYRYFPRGTVHVVVVDPGVGGDRRAVALQTPEAAFIGPDNGVFTLIIEEAQRERGRDLHIVELNQPQFWLPQVSSTFHGRDVFAPVAAHLVRGASLAELGRPLDTLTLARIATPQPLGRNVIQGQIIHVDHFGNCITNITLEHLFSYDLGRRIVVEIIDQQLPGLFRTYIEGPTGTPMCLIGSSGHLELALSNGNAAKHLGVDIGDKLRVRSLTESER
jgi:hypothetical protein